MKCVTCQCRTDKYKCPKCFENYCSLQCYKTHCETPCNPPHVETVAEEKIDDRLPMPFKTQDTVSIEKLEALEHSESLRKLLYNQHMRKFLSEVDSAPNAWKAITAAMQEPLFEEFADECMKIVEPLDDKDNI